MKYSKKLLIIPDIHTHYAKVERIMAKYYKTHKFIFLGDYFDQFGDTPELNASTAHWLKTTMNEFPEWVYLYGNHDVQYHPNYRCMCSGFSTQKKTAINEVFTIDDWDKLKYFHSENNHWFSHAGITKYWFQHPMKDGITEENIQSIISEAVIKLQNDNHDNAIWAVTPHRGGGSVVGGLVWNDWREMELIPNVNQVVGHTPIKKKATISDNATNCSITNLDTSAGGVYFSDLMEIDESGHRNTIMASYL
jgi:hypothetical protein